MAKVTARDVDIRKKKPTECNGNGQAVCRKMIAEANHTSMKQTNHCEACLPHVLIFIFLLFLLLVVLLPS